MKTNSRYLRIKIKFNLTSLRLVPLILGLLFSNWAQAQQGNTCSSAYNVSELPFSHSGDLLSYGNDYNVYDVPDEVNNPFHTKEFNPNYINGSDVVYQFTPETSGYVDVSLITSQLNASVWVFVDCPTFGATVGWDYSSTGYSCEILNLQVYATETFYFVLSSNSNSANYSFDFEIKSAMGKKCEGPLPINSLPFEHNGVISDYGNNYNYNDLPPTAPDAVGNVGYYLSYINGNEAVYAYTAASDGFVFAASFADAYNRGMYVFTGCPFELAVGWDRALNPSNVLTVNIPVSAGQTYYFVMSSSQSTSNFSYTFTLEESVGVVCEAPIDVSGIPLPISLVGEVPSFKNNYSANDLPPISPDAIHNVPYNHIYMNGPERVISYTPESDGYVDARVISEESSVSIWVFTGCPLESTLGWDYSVNEDYREIKKIPVSAGETYYFFLSRVNLLSFEYQFSLTESDRGEICEWSIDIESLPFLHQENVADYGNDYDETDVPDPVPNPISNIAFQPFRINGYDVTYQYTPEQDQTVNAKVFGDGENLALWVFTGCPFEHTLGWDLVNSYDELVVPNIPLEGGTTYYFVVSSLFENSHDFDFELSEAIDYDCPDLEKNIGDPCDDGLTNTIADYVRESCECAGYEVNSTMNFTIPQNSACGGRLFRAIFYVENTDVVLYQKVKSLPSSTTTFTILNLPVGTIDMYIEMEGVLRVFLESQTITAGTNNIVIPTIVSGDLNADNVINVTDFSVIVNLFVDGTYNALADLNCDDVINIVDFSGLSVNFGVQGAPLP